VLWVPEGFPAWAEVLNTDAARYGGSGVVGPRPVRADADPDAAALGVRLTLPPLATVWLRPV
jgi:1,4-alpha-glucan branching enzyme